MARHAAAVTIDARPANGVPLLGQAGGIADPINGATIATTQAAVEDAVAVLEADGASPTQAHVVDLRAAWDAQVLVTAAYPAQSDVVLSVNAANVVTRSVLRAAVQRLLQMFEGSNALTP